MNTKFENKDSLRASIVEHYNLDAIFSSVEKSIEEKIQKMMLNFSDEERKGMSNAYEKICEIEEYRYRVILMSSFYDYLAQLVEKKVKGELVKDEISETEESTCLSFEHLALTEKDLDYMVKEKIDAFSDELHRAFAETYETISTIKNIYNRKIMKYDFYTYLESCVGVQEKDIYFVSYAELEETEKNVDFAIKNKITMFSEESKEGFAETYEKLSSIKNVYNRKVMKDSFYNYLEYCVNAMIDEE